MTDEDIILILSKYKQIKWKFIDNNIKEYLLNRYNDNYSIDEKFILKESYYRILNKFNICPTCSICGNKRKFLYYENKYSNTCGSPKCLAKECQKRREQTNLNKYGYRARFENENTRQIAKQSIINKYGVDNVLKLTEIQQKASKTKLEKYGNENYNNQEKIKQTCLEKYGVEFPLANKKIWQQTRNHTIEKYGAAYNKEKLNETLMQKYGVKWFTQSQKLKDRANSKEAKQKQYVTKKKNHTFNSSKLENESYELLKEKYLDIQYQYKSKLYPFACDFYIPSLNLYIECNYHWTHGGKLYEGTEEDNIKLNIWKRKNTQYYNNAINTWTNLDVNKYNIAKQNKLNYLIFYTIFELQNWLNNGKT